MDAGKCPSCGSKLGAGALAGLCPRCLINADAQREGASVLLAEPPTRHEPPAPTAAAEAPEPPDQTADTGATRGQTPGSAETEDARDYDGPAPDEAARWSDRPPGPRIEGYEILRELNRGGQGVVYLAVQCSTRRKVAVKVLLAGAFATRSARRRFEREIELVAGFKHPNIIAVFDSGTTAGGHEFCVMDYVRGVPFTAYAREKGLTLDQVLALFATACEAVNHAHLRGVIHRDLKPGNILVDAEGNLRVLDFGLAKALVGPVESIVSVTGDVVGTFPYMSPEQTRANPDEMDTRTDVYALGVILYEALTGKYPYPVDGTVAEVVRHIVETPPAPPARNWDPASGVPGGAGRRGRGGRGGRCPIDADLETILLKALSKERDRRYDNAGHFARDVRRYLAKEPIVARRPSAWYQLRMLSRRHRAVVLATIGILFGLLVGVIVSTTFALWLRSANERAETEKNNAELAQARAEHSKAEAEHALASGLAWWGAQLQSSKEYLAAWKAYGQAVDAAGRFNVSPAAQLPILGGIIELTSLVDVPLMGPFGAEGGVGGLGGYQREVNAVAVCRDGWTAVACGEDGRVCRWDLRTGALLREYRRDVDEAEPRFRGVNYVTLPRDGKRLLGSGDDGRATLWDLESGEVLKTLDSEAREEAVPRGTWSVAFSPDGRYALTGGDEFAENGSDGAVLRLWDLQTPRRDLRKSDSVLFEADSPHLGSIAGIAFRDLNTAVTAGHDGTLKTWDLRTRRLIATLNPHDQPGERNEINDVVVMPDGRHAVTASFGGYVGLWDLDAGLEHRLEGHKGVVWRVAASSDGRTVASAGRDGTTRLWDVATRTQTAVLYGAPDDVMDVDFSPDLRIVVSGGRGRKLAVWAVPVAKGADATAAPRRAVVTCLCVSDGPGRVILAGSQDGSVALWDAATERLLRTWPVHVTPVRAVWVSRDGTRAASIAADGNVATWDVGSDSAGSAQGRADLRAVDCAAFFPDGQSVLLSSGGALRRCNVRDGKPPQALQWPVASARGLAVSGDGKTALATTADGRVHLLDLASGSTLPSGMPTAITAVAVAALDPSARMAISDAGDTDVRLWEVSSRDDPPRRLKGHQARVTAVALSPDAGCAASGAADGTVRAWDFAAAARYRNFEKELSAIRRDRPLTPAVVARFGEWQALRGRDDWAVQLLEQASRDGVKVDPLVLGRCYWRLGKIEPARAEFRKALGEPRTDPYVHHCLRALDAGQGE